MFLEYYTWSQLAYVVDFDEQCSLST